MVLYGASGHGKVIKDIADSQGRKVEGFIDDNTEIDTLSGLPVKHSVTAGDEVVISIGLNKVRKMVSEKIPCSIADALVHASAVVSPSAVIGEGTVVMSGALINADVRIGRHCIVNTGASIDHDCKIDDFVHISPHATLCGNVSVGEGTWIGAGTVVIQGVKIGRWAMVGAGSVVTKDIPDGWLAVGNRCMLIKEINQDMIQQKQIADAHHRNSDH